MRVLASEALSWSKIATPVRARAAEEDVIATEFVTP
jgi:hypothetical protein